MGSIANEVHGDYPEIHCATGACKFEGRLYLASPNVPDPLEIDLTERTNP